MKKNSGGGVDDSDGGSRGKMEEIGRKGGRGNLGWDVKTKM